MKSLFFITFIAVIFISKAICAFAFEAKDFYPLRKGTINKYLFYEINAKNGRVNNKRRGFDTRTYLGNQIINGQVVFAVKTEFSYKNVAKSKTTKIFYYILKKEGLVFFGRRFDNNRKEPLIIYDGPRYQIKNPIKVGTSWENRYRGYTDIVNIVEVNKTISTSYSKYENCIKIKLERSHIDGYKRYENHWYCPGVGRVQRVSKSYEKVNKDWFRNTKMVLIEQIHDNLSSDGTSKK